MTIKFMDDYILLESSYIDELIATPEDYTKLDITGIINCCPTDCGQQENTISFLNPFTTTSKLELTAEGIKVFPAFFGVTEFTDGIYKFSVKRYEDGVGAVLETNCIFVDITIKCKLTVLLKSIITENKTAVEKKSTIAHLLHYGLVNGSNCGCNCEEMCEAYTYLDTILSTINPQIFADCGC